LRTLPAGIPALNDLLPGGGWPGTGLVEVITTREYAAAMALFLPLLSRFGRQNRWLAMVTPPYPPRHRLYTDPGINPERVLQVNPHPGRSGLWTVESLLRSGTCSTVMAWPCCTTELMGKRLQRAAAIGRTLGILFRQEWQSRPTSGVDVRLRLETGAHGQVLYLLDACGDVLAGTTLDFPQGSNIV
jgi:cell division inhibitor SulA/protein ImuA